MIHCYVLQVNTGKEELFIEHVKNLHRGKMPCKLILPRRELTIRKKGKFHKTVKPVFPSYIFWETGDPAPKTRAMLRRIPGFNRFMKDNKGNLIPLTEDDRMIISSLTVDGEIARKSVITFDRNNRVRVLKGPLKGNEGSIIKVDRRKRRVTVELHLYDKRFKIDLEYEEVEKQKTPSNSER